MSLVTLGGLVMIAAANGLSHALLAAPDYEAVTLIDLSGRMNQEMREDIPSLGARPDEAAWVQTEFERLHARVLWFPVISNLDLGRRFAEEFHEPDAFAPETVYQLLRRRVSIRPRNKAMMAIAVRSPSATNAAAVANGIATVYRDQAAARWREMTRLGIQAMEADLPRMTNSATKERLRTRIEAEKSDLQQDNSGVSIVEQAVPPTRPMSSLCRWIPLAFGLGVALLLAGIHLLMTPRNAGDVA
ncbi:MAG TPA: hypothetical protein VNH84_05270 [Candidatus Saccharimonadales bacterium]|nr:hypothetical protein [Candidatus Saccharimonadales bacterium]